MSSSDTTRNFKTENCTHHKLEKAILFWSGGKRTPYDETNRFKYPYAARCIAKIKLDSVGNPVFSTDEQKNKFNELVNTSEKDNPYGLLETRMFLENPSRLGDRTWIQYGKDIVYSWIIEDEFAVSLLRNGFVVKYNGIDCNRNIIVEEVTNEPDFLIEKDGHSRFLEFQFGTSNVCDNCNIIQCRQEKFPHLVESKAIIFDFNMNDCTFGWIDLAFENVDSKVMYHERLHKLFHTVYLSQLHRTYDDDKNYASVLYNCIMKDASMVSQICHNAKCSTIEDYKYINTSPSKEGTRKLKEWCDLNNKEFLLGDYL